MPRRITWTPASFRCRTCSTCSGTTGTGNSRGASSGSVRPPRGCTRSIAGATTIWEEWAAISEDGDVGPASLNHYAFGCVDDWLYRRIAGIEPAEPGYRVVRIEPDLDIELEWADGWHETPWGTVRVSWKRDPGESAGVRIDIRLPPGVEGELHLPSPGGTEVHRVSSGEWTFHTDKTEVLS